jgi:hypothetical protein
MSSMPCVYVPSDEGEEYDSRKNFCVDFREGSCKVCRKTVVEIKAKDSSADTELVTIGLQTWTGLGLTNLMPYEPTAGRLLGFERVCHGSRTILLLAFTQEKALYTGVNECTQM